MVTMPSKLKSIIFHPKLLSLYILVESENVKSLDKDKKKKGFTGAKRKTGKQNTRILRLHASAQMFSMVTSRLLFFPLTKRLGSKETLARDKL